LCVGVELIVDIGLACCILHNMCIDEDEDYAAVAIDPAEAEDPRRPELPRIGGEEAARRGRQQRNEIVALMSA
jgi:hypothetical protein